MDNRYTFFNKPRPVQRVRAATEVVEPLPEVVDDTTELIAEATETVVESREFVSESVVRTVETESSTPISVPTAKVAEPIKPPSVLSNILSKVTGNANILQLLLLGAVFFMGNQFGTGCQKQQQIRQQIKAIEREHLATLKLMDSLQIASAKREAETLKQVNDFYTVLQGLDLKSEIVKTKLKEAQTKIAVKREEAVAIAVKHNDVIQERIKEGPKRSSYFDMITEDSLANK
jgi:hypothetical protein